jgi:uncharacterized protein YbjT (DUF2867 family)
VGASGKFNVTLLIRKPPKNRTFLPKNVTVVEVDFTSHSALVEVLSGIDAAIQNTILGPGSAQDILGIELINAAIEAKTVKLFIPSEWGPDTTVSAENVVSAPKRAVHNYLYTKAADPTHNLSYTFVMTGVVLEACTNATFSLPERVKYSLTNLDCSYRYWHDGV